REPPHGRRPHLAALPPHPRAPRPAGDLVPRHPAVPVDVEPVPAGHRPGRRPRQPHHAGRAGRLPRTECHRPPAALRGIAAHPHAHAPDLPDLPASLRQGPAPGLAEGLMRMYGGIEAGGTKWVCAVADAGGRLVATGVIPTTTPEETIERVVRFFADHPGLAALGIGSFGPVDLRAGSPTYGRIMGTPKPGWD